MKKKFIGILLFTGMILSACSNKEMSFDKERTQEELTSQYKTEKIEEKENETEKLSSEDFIVIEQIKSMDQVDNEEESQKIINLISKLPEQDYTSAIKYEENTQEPFTDENIVLLAQDKTEKVNIYGYESSKYGARGIIVNYDDIYSYFDYSWNRTQGRRDIFVKDYNQDGMNEIYFCFQGPVGTGVSIERLLVFETDSQNEGLKAFEFTGQMQDEKIKDILKFDINTDNHLVIDKNGKTEKIIDLNEYSDIYGIDYLNQIKYSFSDEKVMMCIDIGVWFSKSGPGICFSEDKGKICFELAYSNGQFELK